MADEKKVSLTQAQLDTLMNKIDSLEKAVKGGTQKPKRITEHTATLREWEGKLVIGNKRSYNKLNERTMQEEAKIKLLLIDSIGAEPTEEEVNLLDYLNDGLRVQVKIVSQVAKEIEKVQGSTITTPTHEVYYKKNHISFKSEDVDLIVTSVEYTSKIEVLEGKFTGETMEINNKFLND
jgi:hypothetical protein